MQEYHEWRTIRSSDEKQLGNIFHTSLTAVTMNGDLFHSQILSTWDRRIYILSRLI